MQKVAVRESDREGPTKSRLVEHQCQAPRAPVLPKDGVRDPGAATDSAPPCRTPTASESPIDPVSQIASQQLIRQWPHLVVPDRVTAILVGVINVLKDLSVVFRDMTSTPVWTT